jgi:HK97 family phage portal protein
MNEILGMRMDGQVDSYGTLESGDFSAENIWADDPLVMGDRSAAGIAVTRDSAMRHDGVWRAVQMLSNDIAKTNRHVYQLEEDGDRIRDKKHAVGRMLRIAPNPDMSAFNFFKGMNTQLFIGGNAYAFIVRDPETQVPLRLRPLDARLMYPFRDPDDVLKYAYMVGGTNPVIAGAMEILHVRYWTWDGVVGMSPLHYARDTFGLGLGANRWQSVFFKNGSSIRLLLEHPGKLKDDAVMNRLKQSFNEIYSGVDNAHKTAVLEEGMTAKPLQVNAKDAQLVELLQMNMKQIANIYGIPPHKLGDSSNVSYSSLEQENQAYLDSALDPIMKCWEEELMLKLLSPAEQESESHFIEFDRMAWLRADSVTQAEIFNKALAGAPYMTINQARRMVNMPKLDDPKADEIPFPTNNFAPTPEAPKADEPPAPPAKPDISQSAITRPAIELLQKAAVRGFKRCCQQAAKELKEGGIQTFLVSFRGEMSESVESEFCSISRLFEGYGVGAASVLVDKWRDATLDSISEFTIALNENPAKKAETQTRICVNLENQMEAFCNEN